ncbi:MAG: methyltransferase domain-containing protein [Anaerolineae bacterium]|jgi:SAM-dependent methyltransferase|nr:methyltransferase domain-containing protein [Anaerolineae bacterium]MBT7190269.1 methyltransferase domain-containing protein [Anaerolineae bacterium]MBT7988615.1 methyltransferase domain-containing protein [Anaerolineae bacterium]
MDIAILQRELNELQNAPALFDEQNFRARKEALDFVGIINKFYPEQNIELIRLQEQAQRLGEDLRVFNATIAKKWFDRLKNERPSHRNLRNGLQPYTDYAPQKWGKPHYGYENLDFLLDETLLPQPHPQASLAPDYGMVRYEPTPASVILELTERITFTENDVFYDLGSGLGKVTMLVHLLTGARCVGVEYQPDFCAYADQQAHGLDLNKVTYINTDARHVDYSDATVFFFFNPFGGTIFDKVLERLHEQAQQREIRICSYGSGSQPLSENHWLKHIPPINEDELALAIFEHHSTS